MSSQNQNLFPKSLKEPAPAWTRWSPNNKPPFNWEDPTIRFWRDVLGRPLPPPNFDSHMEVKWEPLTRGMYDNAKARFKAAVLLEYQAQLLREMTDGDNTMMTRFGYYLKDKEQAWFRVGGRIEEDFDKAMAAPPEEPGGVGMFLKFIFPIIRWRCNRDELSEITGEIFRDA